MTKNDFYVHHTYAFRNCNLFLLNTFCSSNFAQGSKSHQDLVYHLSQLSAHIRQNTDLPPQAENVEIKHNKPTYFSEILDFLNYLQYAGIFYYFLTLLKSVFLLLCCQSRAPLWQAGYGHSKPSRNHEAQQGSVKLSFLCQLRLLTSTRECVNPDKDNFSVWISQNLNVLFCTVTCIKVSTNLYHERD